MDNKFSSHLTNNFCENFHSLLNKKFYQKPKINEFMKSFGMLVEERFFKY